jgi:hypothetical protein
MSNARMATALAFGVWLAPSAAYAQFCPCYTASSPNNNNGCAIDALPGMNPSDADWQPIFDLVSQGPSVWGDAGPTVDDIGQGCGKPEPLMQVPARFPCELLKAIAMAESGWRQFWVPTEPGDQVGGAERTVISFDCGYGVSQVTSGMHVGENPDFDRQRVASDPTYNLATGTRILAEKWGYTECVGDNQPRIIEHWYTATWAYNGLAYVNNPNNPNYDPNRGVYDPAVGGSVPYQERVFGRIEYTSGKWDPTELAYPNPGDIGNGTSPPSLPEPSCASPTDCVNTRQVHETVCNGQQGGQGGQEPSAVAAGVGGGATGGMSDVGGDAAIARGVPGEGDGCSCRLATLQKPAENTRSWLTLVAFALLGRRRRKCAA